MAKIIRHHVTFYKINGYDDFYRGTARQLGGAYVRAVKLKKLIDDCALPHVVKTINVRDILNISISELGEVHSDLNIILVPTDISIFRLLVHSDFIFLFISFPTSSYKCKGPRTYYSFMRRATLGLTKLKQFDILYKRRPRKHNRSYKFGTAVKVVDLACSVDIVDPRMYDAFYKEIRKEIDNPTLRNNMMKLVKLKKKLFYRYVTKEQLLERLKDGFKFDGKEFPGIDTI